MGKGSGGGGRGAAPGDAVNPVAVEAPYDTTTDLLLVGEAGAAEGRSHQAKLVGRAREGGIRSFTSRTSQRV
jgi:hypothetical protein